VLALARDAQHVVFQLDVDVVLAHPRQIGPQHVVLVLLDEVHRRDPTINHARPAVGLAGVIEERAEQAVHLTLQRGQLARGLPTNQRHEMPPLTRQI
jgi:hypothetical protein